MESTFLTLPNRIGHFFFHVTASVLEFVSLFLASFGKSEITKKRKKKV